MTPEVYIDFINKFDKLYNNLQGKFNFPETIFSK